MFARRRTTSTLDEVFAAALALPPNERALLANRLFKSVDDPAEDRTDEHFEQTVLDRLAEYDRGDTVASDWDEVKARIEATINPKSPYEGAILACR
jgi:putative addiction module component (TIGR02574 family)